MLGGVGDDNPESRISFFGLTVGLMGLDDGYTEPVVLEYVRDEGTGLEGGGGEVRGEVRGRGSNAS